MNISNATLFTLPLFPLPLFLLPEGITRLRIFEQRYLKMVKLAAKNNGFAILPNVQKESSSAEGQQPHWASWVEIINFDQGDDGVLLIDVRCKSLIEVVDVSLDEDNLHFCVATIKAHWDESYEDETTHELSEALQQLFNQNQELSSLYENNLINQPSWVIARWLELLPINLAEKVLFSEDNSFEQAKDFVASVVCE